MEPVAQHPYASEAQSSMIADLDLMRDALPGKTKSFASDLIHGKWGFHNRQGKLSKKQWSWVEKLLAQALGTGDGPKATVVKTNDLTPILTFMQAAKMQFPKLSFVLKVEGTEEFDGEDEQILELRLSRAGAKAKMPGTLNLTDFGSYPTNKWYGRIHKDGSWHPSQQGASADIAGVLVAFLETLAANPPETAILYGKGTGNCCFCNAELTDPKSKAAGFGPTCAANYGLLEAYNEATLVG